MIIACDAFENVWLKESTKFILGDKLTIADLLATTELEQPRKFIFNNNQRTF